MEIKIGIQQGRELVIDTPASSADVEAALTKALADNTMFAVADENGGRVLIAPDKIAYVELGKEHSRRVGFGRV